MTREEIAESLKLLKEQALKSHNDTAILDVKVESFVWVVESAIKALSQEPCDDAVSREWLKKKLQEHHDFFVNAYGGFKNMPQTDKARVDEITNCIAEVVNAPSVTPQPCEDAVSRASVIKFEGTNMACMGGDEIMKEFENNTQEPCDDAISRDMALEKMADYVASGYADSAEDFEEYSRIICQLPSVTQKSGKWIFDDNSSATVCPNCKQGYLWEDYKGTSEWNFCPNCGAKMGSEDKE